MENTTERVDLGLFTNDEFKVSATAEDATSLCVIEYLRHPIAIKASLMKRV